MEDEGCEVFASNQVIGEAYVAIQNHYQVSDMDARAALIDVLTSGLVAPLNGQSVILALQAWGGSVRQADRRRLLKSRDGHPDSGPEDVFPAKGKKAVAHDSAPLVSQEIPKRFTRLPKSGWAGHCRPTTRFSHQVNPSGRTGGLENCTSSS